MNTLYLDTSAFLKLLLPEPESKQVEHAIAAEAEVVVSSLTEFETVIQLHAARSGGKLTKPKLRRLLDRLDTLKALDPFRFAPLPGTVFATATRQQSSLPRLHCRTLDRLHLAAMEELGINRLMTYDARQATVARTLGFNVVAA